MTPIEKHNENLSKTLIKQLERRGFEACYAATKNDALNKAISYLKPGCTVANGGSMSLADIGFNEALKGTGCIYLDRFLPKTDEERDVVFSKIAVCDYYFMSTNALTLDGQLVNVDGTGNRLASLLHGPKNVIIITSLDKVCKDVESAYNRIKTCVAPPNCVRLGRKTPCAITGECADCLSPDCICTHTVITRRSNIPNRIKIILVGEKIGY